MFTPIIGCLCGGVLETMFALFMLSGCGTTWFFTKYFNKCQQKCCQAKNSKGKKNELKE